MRIRYFACRGKEKEYEEAIQWREYFCWLPTRVGAEIAWLEFIERRYTGPKFTYIYTFCSSYWEYKVEEGITESEMKKVTLNSKVTPLSARRAVEIINSNILSLSEELGASMYDAHGYLLFAMGVIAGQQGRIDGNHKESKLTAPFIAGYDYFNSINGKK